MKTVFALAIAAHGGLHLLGAAKAFGWATLPQIERPVSPLMGVLWLVACGLFLATAVGLLIWPKGAWGVGFAAVAMSTLVIVASWSDARFGMLPNVFVLAGMGFVLYNAGPASLRSAYQRDVERSLATSTSTARIVEVDLAGLPPPVARYLTWSGVVGQPRVSSYRVRMHGRIRSGPDATWMPFTAEQVNVVASGTRLFYLDATMFGLPVRGFHRFVGADAVMDIRLMGAIPVQRAAGPAMARAETVTVFNDMCFFAPATLVEPSVRWTPIDANTVRATFTRGDITISAVLSFDDAGQLVNFWSDDRAETLPDGTLKRARWSTPVRGHRRAGPFLRLSAGEARWQEAGRDDAYIEVFVDDVAYNVQVD